MHDISIGVGMVTLLNTNDEFGAIGALNRARCNTHFQFGDVYNKYRKYDVDA